MTTTKDLPHNTVSPDSALFATAVEHYTRHGATRGGRRTCGSGRCAVRLHAASVIAAAGINPTQFDPPPRRPDAAPWEREVTAALPVLQGEPADGGSS
jgi:hypothetical protein